MNPIKIKLESEEQAKEMLNHSYAKFGGCFQTNDRTDEDFAVTNCNGFETVFIDFEKKNEDPDDKEGEWSLKITQNYYERGEEIMEYIEEGLQNPETFQLIYG